jgi:hypothetical protein
MTYEDEDTCKYGRPAHVSVGSRGSDATTCSLKRLMIPMKKPPLL